MKMNVGWLWFKDPNGKASTTLSFAIVAFWVVVFKVIFGGMSFTFGRQTFQIIAIDPGMVAALLTPTLGAYVARKYTDARFIDENNNGIDDREENGKEEAKEAKEAKDGQDL